MALLRPRERKENILQKKQKKQEIQKQKTTKKINES